MDDLKINQIKQSVEILQPQSRPIKKGSWGGPRPGAGRPRGSGHKIELEKLIDALKLTLGKDFEHILAEDLLRFRNDSLMGDNTTEYLALLKWAGDKIIAKQKDEMDITSNGESIQPTTYIFTTKELPDWEASNNNES